MPSNRQKEKLLGFEKQIIDLLTATPQFLPDIYRELGARKKKDFKLVQNTVKSLEKKRLIVSDRKGLFRAVIKQNNIKGRIIISARGYGFVERIDTDKEEDIFIPAKYINGALDGDIVEVRIISDEQDVRRKPGKGPVGIVNKVIEHKRPNLVGELVVKRDGFYLKALNRRIPDDIKICGDVENAKRGDWLQAKIVYDESGSIACQYVKKIGKVGNIEDDVDAIVSEYNLHSPYTEEQEKAADEITPVEGKREDLTDLFCVTIDPHDAKDFDDSVSVSDGIKDDEIILGIHIADVAAWISPGSWIDKEAKERGYTAYIPGRTLPMLPKNLTKNISLREDKDFNFAHSVMLTVDKNTGMIKNYNRVRSKIKIAKRLTFAEVEDFIISGNPPVNWNDLLKLNLEKLTSLYRIMRNYREDQEKFLNMETTEIRVLRNDSDGKILGIERKKQGEADCMVEEFMLAANSTVAKEFVNDRIPGIFRVHPEPEPEKLEEYSEFINDVFSISTGNLASGRKACQNFLRKIKGHKHEEIIIGFFLRAMNRALYSEKYSLHYGLGKGLYLHFTSPIRRYPDLIVHQQLLLKEQGKNYLSEEFVKKTALECTEQEKNNDEAYFAANDRLKLHYLQDLLSKNELDLYEGIISNVNAGGMLADIPAIGLSAYIPIESINGTFNKRYGRLVSEKGGTEYKPGDFVFLKLEKIDFIKGSAIFKPVQY